MTPLATFDPMTNSIEHEMEWFKQGFANCGPRTKHLVELLDSELGALRARLEIALAGHRENEISARIIESENSRLGHSYQIKLDCGFIKARARAALKETP